MFKIETIDDEVVNSRGLYNFTGFDASLEVVDAVDPSFVDHAEVVVIVEAN